MIECPTLRACPHTGCTAQSCACPPCSCPTCQRRHAKATGCKPEQLTLAATEPEARP